MTTVHLLNSKYMACDFCTR